MMMLMKIDNNFVYRVIRVGKIAMLSRTTLKEKIWSDGWGLDFEHLEFEHLDFEHLDFEDL